MAELRVKRRPLPFRFLQQANREANKHFRDLLRASLTRIETQLRALPTDSQEGTFIAMTKALAPISGDQPIIDWRRRHQYGQGEELTGCWSEETAERYLEVLEELEIRGGYQVPYLRMKEEVATSTQEREVLKKTADLVLIKPPTRDKLLAVMIKKQPVPLVTQDGLVLAGGEQVMFARLLGMQALLCRERNATTKDGKLQKPMDWMSEDFLNLRARALSRAKCRRYAIPSCMEPTAEIARRHDSDFFLLLSQGDQAIVGQYHRAMEKHSQEQYRLWTQLFKQFTAMGQDEESAKLQISESPIWKSRSKQSDAELQKEEVSVSVKLRQQKELEAAIQQSKDLIAQDDYQPSRSYNDPKFLWKESQVDSTGLFLQRQEEGINVGVASVSFAAGESVEVEDVTGAKRKAVVLSSDGYRTKVRREDGEVRVIRGTEGIRRK